MVRQGFFKRQIAAVPAGVILAVAVLAVPAHAQGAGQWQFTGSLAYGHGNTHLVQLRDGRVLAISGDLGNGVYTNTAEIYNPDTGQWTSAGTLADARVAFGQPSVLPDGDVLVAGGHDPTVTDWGTAELYDPATNQWTMTGSLNTPRRYDVQVELADGEVLVATGSFGGPTCNRFLSSAELYNPATGQWTYTGSTLVPREGAFAIVLADGRVLLAGGYNGGTNCTDTDPVDTEIYDPSTGQWSFAGDLPHGWLNGTMVLLPDHRVLLVDGWQHGGSNTAEAEIFDPATNQWTAAATPILPRSSAAATLLPDGDVLVSQGNQLQSEIYDPATNTWSLDATALDDNNNGQTIVLPDGQVLLAGGDNASGPSTTTELYTPAGGAGQTISFTPQGTGTYGGQAALSATGGGSGNPVVFTVDPSGTPGACAVSGANGTTLSYTGTGSCVIDANQAAGNGFTAAAQAQQPVTVSPAPLSITASSPTMTQGGTVPAITASYSGFVNSDGPNSLTTQPSCSTTATSSSPPGSYPATCTGAADPNYAITYAPGTLTVTPPSCPPGTTANFRWHYRANGSAGGWSGTKTASCPGSLTMGPQAMEGDLKVNPGTTIQAGYDLTIPGNNSARTLTLTNPQVTFTVRCVSGATPSAPTFTVTMPAATYTITGSSWNPSGDQSSPLVYQGSYTVPDLCAGGQIRLDKGGTFTTTLS